MNYRAIEFYVKMEVLACKEELNEKTNIMEYRVLYPNGSCKSEVNVPKLGVQKFKINTFSYNNKVFIKITDIVKTKKTKVVNKSERKK